MKISYSAITSYLECPLRYRFIAIEHKRPKQQPYFSFGRTIHRVLRFFYADPLFDFPDLKDVCLYYRKKWERAGYRDFKQEGEYFRLGLAILANFHTEESKNSTRPIALEYRFHINLNGHAIEGIVDRIDKFDGGFELVDYKTSRYLPGSKDLKDDLQLALYQLGAGSHFDIPIVRLSIYHLRSMTKISIPAHSEENLKETAQYINGIADQIEQGDFEPRLHDSCPCEFGSSCPYFIERHQKEENIAEVVDEFGALKEELRSERKKTDKLYDLINEYLDEHGFEQTFGDKFSVYRKSYSERSLKKSIWRILDENDLWQEVELWLQEKRYQVEIEEQKRSRLYVRRRDV